MFVYNCLTKLYVYIQLEDALRLSSQDLKYASTTIQADLDRFQRQKVADLREMCVNLAISHRDWCKKVSLLQNHSLCRSLNLGIRT